MKKFVFLYQGQGQAEPTADSMKAWGDWFARVGEHMVEAARRLPDEHRGAHLRGDADAAGRDRTRGRNSSFEPVAGCYGSGLSPARWLKPVAGGYDPQSTTHNHHEAV